MADNMFDKVAQEMMGGGIGGRPKGPPKPPKPKGMKKKQRSQSMADFIKKRNKPKKKY